MGRPPTQSDEKRLLSKADLPWERRPHLCHLDRSEAQWRDLCVDATSWRCFSTERTRISCHAAADEAACAPFFQGKAHDVCQRHQLPQEIRGSGEICDFF
jgi:hypothetical protein